MKNVMFSILPILFGVFVGQVAGQSEACLTCFFGVAAENGGSPVLRFGTNESVATSALNSLVTAGFPEINSTSACDTHNVCGENSNCNVNSTKIFVCDCEDQYTAVRETQTFTCEDTNECATSTTHNCSSIGGVCTNNNPGFTCACSAGYSGDGYNCTNIDECSPNPCATNGICTEPEINTYNCSCDDGYDGDGNSSCVDIDECSGTHGCHLNATCSNTNGSFTCACDAGYTGNGTSCDDIDECGANPCHADADCTNQINNYTCACRNGYTGDGVTCDKTRADMKVNFTITCMDLTYDGDLNVTTSPLYGNVTAALEAAIATFVPTVDGSAGVANVTFTFLNSTDGLGSAEALVDLFVNNTNLEPDDFLKVVDTISETVECNAKASGDECTLGIDDCATGTTCADTPYGFCCNAGIEFTGAIRYSDAFDASYANITSTNSTLLLDDAKSRFLTAIGRIQTRGCNQTIVTEYKKIVEGSSIAVLLLSIVDATYTAQDIADEMAKLENTNTTFGTIIKSGDFDECVDAYETDRNCSAFATCSNFIGSFTCECNNTYYDNGTSINGELCIVPVTVSCSASSISISIVSDYYTRQNVNITDLHLADHSCNYSTHSTIVGDTIQFEMNINDCNTTLSSDANNTVILASNSISNLPASGLFTGPAINVPFQCSLPSVLNITVGANGTATVVELPDVVTDGTFDLEFGLYDPTYATKKDLSTSVFGSQDTIYGQIKVVNNITDVGVFIEDCWGTSTNDRNDPNKVQFVEDGCSLDAVENFVFASNGDGSARFSAQMFYFTQNNAIYLHCDVSVCTPSCTKTCSRKRRRRRSEPTTRSDGVTISIRLVVDPNDPNFNSTVIDIYGLVPQTPNHNANNVNNVNDITLPIVGAILAFLLIILLVLVVVVIFRKQRSKANDYDLTHVNMHAIGVKPPTYQH